jgi:metal-dependent amidase/aminoacylase/carboxypeptidase family protein
VTGVTDGAGAHSKVEWSNVFAPLINHPAHTIIMAEAATALVGEGRVTMNEQPVMISEDFSFMLERVPGAYIQMGIGDSAELHNAAYAFNDDAIPYGAALYASLAERPHNMTHDAKV